MADEEIVVQWWDRTVHGWHQYKNNVLVATRYTESDTDCWPGITIVKKQPDRELGTTNRLKKKNYLSNKELLKEIALSKAQGKMNEKLAQMLLMLVHRISRKGNFCNYTYLSDMRSEAIVTLMSNWDRFDAEKSQNPFSYYTTVIHHGYLSVLAKEKKQRNIRDKMLLENGMDASAGFMEDSDRELY